MIGIIKLCLTCNKPVKGRTDKKFCNDYCRNSYNNQINCVCNNDVRHINSILQKNRRILASLLANSGVSVKASQIQLLEKGFVFKYCTHHQENKKGTHYHFCYEYGYLPISSDAYIIVRKESERQLTKIAITEKKQ